MSLYWEKWHPYLVGTIAFAVWSKLEVKFPTEQTADILSSSITLGAIIAGFLSTSQSILMALSGKVMDHLRASGYVEELISYLNQAILLSFLFSSISLLGFFTVAYPFGPVWSFVGVSLVCSFFRVTKITFAVMRKG